jgi:hypothetical protein
VQVLTPSVAALLPQVNLGKQAALKWTTKLNCKTIELPFS